MELDKIKINEITYQIKDSFAREEFNQLKIQLEQILSTLVEGVEDGDDNG